MLTRFFMGLPFLATAKESLWPHPISQSVLALSMGWPSLQYCLVFSHISCVFTACEHSFLANFAIAPAAHGLVLHEGRPRLAYFSFRSAHEIENRVPVIELDSTSTAFEKQFVYEKVNRVCLERKNLARVQHHRCLRTMGHVKCPMLYARPSHVLGSHLHGLPRPHCPSGLRGPRPDCWCCLVVGVSSRLCVRIAATYIPHRTI